MAPNAVAIIGASDDPTRIGGRPLSYMLRAGFSGPIWPVNPNRDTVQGLPAFASIRDVPAAPDACIVAVAAPLVPEVLDACAQQGAKAAVVLSSGFAETGAKGRAAQDRFAEEARRTGMRVLGPNTLGLFNAHTRWIGTFASTIHHGLPEPGPISIASQSGAVGSELYALLRRRGLNTGIWITTGNEADVDLADAIAYLAGDSDTKIIVAYAEGVRDGPAMREALTLASDEKKPVLFMKSGRSPVGAAAVEAHTAATAGSDPIYAALFRQLGVIRVGNAEELVDAAYAAIRAPLPAGRRLLILTISGGAGVQMADAAADFGLSVPPPSTGAQRELKALLPFAGVRNPVDTTAQVFNDMSLIERYLSILLEDGNYDAIALFLTSVAASQDMARRVIAALDEARANFPHVPLVISLAAQSDFTGMYEEAGYPVFEEPTRAVRALALLSRLSESLGHDIITPPVDIPSDAVRIQPGALDERGSMRILESWGIPCIRDGVAGPEGIDVAVGVVNDATFGPVVTVGLDSPHPELFEDVAFRLAPFGVDEAHRMIAELRGAPLLDARGRPEPDVRALATMLSRVSLFAAAEAGAFSSAHLKRVRVLRGNQGAVVLEALIVPDPTGALLA